MEKQMEDEIGVAVGARHGRPAMMEVQCWS